MIDDELTDDGPPFPCGFCGSLERFEDCDPAHPDRCVSRCQECGSDAP